jgi:hypothetical protein
MNTMTKLKHIEILDRATFIPAIAVRLDSNDTFGGHLIRRAGFKAFGILLADLNYGTGSVDPYGHGDSRTRTVVHLYLEQHWDDVEDGQVIDVEFILGETAESKSSDCMPS